RTGERPPRHRPRSARQPSPRLRHRRRSPIHHSRRPADQIDQRGKSGASAVWVRSPLKQATLPTNSHSPRLYFFGGRFIREVGGGGGVGRFGSRSTSGAASPDAVSDGGART